MAKKSALIVWEGRSPEASATVVAKMLERHGFDATVSDTTAAFAAPDLRARSDFADDHHVHR